MGVRNAMIHPHTALCIWWMSNRPHIEQWASANPTVGGSTYSPRWVEAMQATVDAWREELIKPKQRVWLFGAYLRDVQVVKEVLEEGDG